MIFLLLGKQNADLLLFDCSFLVHLTLSQSIGLTHLMASEWVVSRISPGNDLRDEEGVENHEWL
jgi:hypothetical protein